MGAAVAVVGSVIAGFGAVGVVRPAVLIDALAKMPSARPTIYAIAAARVTVGLILVLGAPSTAAPEVIRFLGVLSLLRAFMVLVIGVDRVRSLIDWFGSRSDLVLRTLFLGAGALGAFLVWAAMNP